MHSKIMRADTCNRQWSVRRTTIDGTRDLVFGLLLVVLGCQCAPSGQRHMGASEITEQPDSDPGNRVLTPETDQLGHARAWIQTVLLQGAEDCTDDERTALRRVAVKAPQSKKADKQPCAEAGRAPADTEAEEVYVYEARARFLTVEDVLLFVEAGEQTIPDLIRLVHDRRCSPCIFAYPLHSAIRSDRMRVGEVACYLIEAILRENPYFSSTARLLYMPPVNATPDEKERYALERAALTYENWYARCFDAQLGRSTCSQDDLPAVQWDYNAEAWPAYLRQFGDTATKP